MPDEKIVVVMNIHGGIVQDVGVPEKNINDVQVIIVDHDAYEESGGEEGVSSRTLSPLERWVNDSESALALCKEELPKNLADHLDIDDPSAVR